MKPDDELCLCFHVTQRKVVNFIRLEKPKRAAQLSECFGAGTGCGWCRPFLRRLFEASQQAESSDACDLPDSESYAQGRSQHVAAGHGTPPPGATPTSAAPTSATPPPPTDGSDKPSSDA